MNSGFTTRRINGGGGVKYAKRPILQSGPKLAPQPTAHVLVQTTTGPVPIKSTGLILPPNIIELMKRGGVGPQPTYTPEQIRIMRERAQTNERSGEKETGTEPELEQQSRAADATKQFTADTNGAPLPPPAAAPDNKLAWIIAAAIGYWILGG